ncbi:MAG: SH3 domain-containing protein, partial [Chloroflexi bacterium]|nr:SH3 domain-containing protein [Chloroflexota bacterium]
MRLLVCILNGELAGFGSDVGMPRRFFVALFLLALLAAPVAGLRPASAGAAASVATLDAPARPAFGQLVPGREAVVRGDGDCLRLRDFPSLSGSQISCVADGTTLDVLEGSVSADGYDWQHVRVHGVAGWVASDFLDPLPPAPACGSQAGSSGIGPGLL